MDKAGQWSLSPAYDMTYAYNPAGEFTSCHQMTINRKRDNILIEDFMAVAGRQGIDTVAAREAIVRVNEAVSHWSDYAQTVGAVDPQSKKIDGLIAPD
jgi:serine/threonine-protein kinase HipA